METVSQKLAPAVREIYVCQRTSVKGAFGTITFSSSVRVDRMAFTSVVDMMED